MKLIIDVPDNIYDAIKITQPFISGKISGKTYLQILVNNVENGTPLDSVIEDIKAEITKEFIDNPQVHFYGDAEEPTASACLEIIDKHIAYMRGE